jgi:hypothetical protein
LESLDAQVGKVLDDNKDAMKQPSDPQVAGAAAGSRRASRPRVQR